MTITGDYCILGEVKKRLWPDGMTPDQINDVELANTITAASRGIDEYTGTRFYAPSADETRYFTPEHYDRLWTGPIISVTSIATDVDGDRTYESAWGATDFELFPWNAVLDSEPYTEIRCTPHGLYYFPLGERSTKVVGKSGWSSTIPALVKEACILQTIKWHHRPDSPFGILSALGQMKIIPVEDPDVQKMLWSFRVNLT